MLLFAFLPRAKAAWDSCSRTVENHERMEAKKTKKRIDD